ncbi:MAG: hypothetical protein ACXWSD_08035 [Bdellovibrionota bacterium]
MGSICLDRLEKIVSGSLGTVAIETGTCRGYGAKALAQSFSRVITIELSAELHRAARDSLSPLANVECLEGNSAELLPGLLAALPAETAFLFFLDAHWSGDRTVPWAASKWKGYGHDTAHLGVPGTTPAGPEQCPLAAELAAIFRHCRGPAAILIDDVKNIGRRDSGFPGEDWTHLSRETLLELVKPRLLEFTELDKPAQWFLRLSRA